MASSIINKTRNAVDVFAGLARIGAGMVKARARTAIGIPTLLDCDACGGTDYTMRVRDGHRVCISCVEVEREDAESARARDASHLDDADAKLSAMRKALTMAGVPESEPYPDDAASDWERSLRTGGYMIGGVTRIQRLATERDAARTELAKVTAERDDARAELATAKKDHIFWRDRRMEICDERDRENAKLATAVAYLATVTAERDNLRQHVALTTRGDGLDDLRVRLANAAIAWGEVLDEDKAYYAEEDAGLLVDELAKAIRAKAEVTT